MNKKNILQFLKSILLTWVIISQKAEEKKVSIWMLFMKSKKNEATYL